VKFGQKFDVLSSFCLLYAAIFVNCNYRSLDGLFSKYSGGVFKDMVHENYNASVLELQFKSKN